MLEREDFLSILKNTIEDYYRVVHSKDIRFSYDRYEGSQIIIINKLMGFVTKVPVPLVLFKHLNSEYNIRGSFSKYILAKTAIVTTCILPNVGKLKYAYISKGTIGHNIVISPQNRSIRFYNYDEGYVDCIIKRGFTNKYFKAQIDFRKSHNYPFLNPLLDSGETWFREPILVGHPLVRETNEHRFQKGTRDVNSYLDKIMQDTLSLTDYREYVDSRISDFEKKIELAVKNKHINTYKESIIILDKIRAVAEKQSNIRIPTCVSHGDLQTGNIWMTPDERTLIYDWETVGRRSIWYDKATFEYELRRAWGWQNLLSSTDISRIYSMNELCGGISVDTIKATVLLEDLHFYIDDMLELPEDWGRKEYDAFIYRIVPLLK